MAADRCLEIVQQTRPCDDRFFMLFSLTLLIVDLTRR